MGVRTFSSDRESPVKVKVTLLFSCFQSVAKIKTVLNYYPCLCIILLYLLELYGLEVRLLYTVCSDLLNFGLQHFWISISMVFLIAATTFTLLKINGKF